MNIYFACSITGGREFEAVYQAITRALLEAGHDVPTAHLASGTVLEMEAIVEPREVYTRDVAWIQACDSLIAEVSVPSHGVGYEVGLALSLEKPVLCLYQEGQRISKMITGNNHPSLTVKAYRDVKQAVSHLRTFLNNDL